MNYTEVFENFFLSFLKHDYIIMIMNQKWDCRTEIDQIYATNKLLKLFCYLYGKQCFW